MKRVFVKVQTVKFYSLLFFAFALSFLSTVENVHARKAENSAVVFAYHRIDEPEYPSSNIDFDQFETHIKELKSGDYYTATLEEIIDALKNDKQLPDKTVAITFEGGHSSILKKAVPLLLKEQIPFTVFLPVDQIDWKSSRYLSWRDIKSLAKEDFVSFGLHTATYSHILDWEEGKIREQINRAKSRFREELGFDADYFAYPFGELNNAIKNMIIEYGFVAAFGQQSGVVHTESDFFMLPRFTMTESYGGIDRFQLTANALPLPVKDFVPNDPLLKENPPAIGFTVSQDIDHMDDLTCFASGMGKTEIQRIGRRVELRLKDSFSGDRARINCTVPAGYTSSGVQRWRWFGALFSLPDQQFEMEEQ